MKSRTLRASVGSTEASNGRLGHVGRIDRRTQGCRCARCSDRRKRRRPAAPQTACGAGRLRVIESAFGTQVSLLVSPLLCTRSRHSEHSQTSHCSIQSIQSAVLQPSPGALPSWRPRAHGVRIASVPCGTGYAALPPAGAKTQTGHQLTPLSTAPATLNHLPSRLVSQTAELADQPVTPAGFAAFSSGWRQIGPQCT